MFDQHQSAVESTYTVGMSTPHNPQRLIAEEIRRIRERAEQSPQEFAKALNVTDGWIYRLENPEDPGIPSEQTIRKLGSIYRADTEVLLTWVDELKAEQRAEKRRAMEEDAAPPNMYPVLGMASAGKWTEAIIDMRAPSGEFRLEEAPPGAAKHPRSFWARIDGDSMLPKLDPGDLVLVDPGQPAEKGKMAFVYCDGKAWIKVWQPKRGRYELHSLNPKYEPIKIDGDAYVAGNGRAFLVVRISKEP